MVMSILSYYARQIFDGTKGYEFRKSPLKEADLNKEIYVYSAKDEKAFVGTFKVSRVLCGNTQEILKLTGYDKRPDGVEIVNYFGEHNPKCFALELYDVKKFKKPITLTELRKVDPNVRLPQYYAYIYKKSAIFERLISAK